MINVRALDLDGEALTPTAITGVGQSRYLSRLEELHLFKPHLGPAEVRALLAREVFPGLRKLTMFEGSLDNRAAPALRALASRDALTVLELGLDNPSPTLLAALLEMPRRAPLRVILSNTDRLPSAALGKLAAMAPASPVTFSVAVRCPELARLDQTGFLKRVSRLRVACGNSGARILSRSANLAALTGIAIDACMGEGDEPDYHMNSAAARTLAATPGLAGLRDLAFTNDFEFCQQPGIGPNGIVAVLAAPFAAQLQSLVLTEQSLGRRGVAALVGGARLPGLRRLVIEGEKMSPTEIRTLVGTGPLAGALEDLTLAGVELEGGYTVDEEGARALIASLNMPRLRRLDISQNPISEPTLARLPRAPWAAKDRILDAAPVGSSSCGRTWSAFER